MLETAVTYFLPALWLLLVAVEALAPRSKFPRISGWRLQGALCLALYSAGAIGLPMLWDAWLAQYRLFDATSLGTWGGALVGILVVQFISYWWHRGLHKLPVLWRWFHQMHHSAERIDVAGAFYFHPLDVAGFTLVGSLGLALVVGVTVEAAIVATLVMTFCVVFQHANLRTPAWLGYLIQRPESHAVHHQRGVHAFNYGDIALWDMLFGTWCNPREWNEQAGFFDGSSRRVLPMLFGRDINAPAAAATPPGPPSQSPAIQRLRDAPSSTTRL